MKPTRQVSDLVAGLRHITGLLEATDVDELPTGVQIYVHLMTSGGSVNEAERKRTVDLLAAAIGQQVAHDSVSSRSKYVNYETTLEGDQDAAWQLQAWTTVRRPDPVAELAAENARLREQLAALTTPAVPAPEPEHFHVGGATGGPGECEASCVCGVAYAGFDTHAEAAALLDEHIARPAPDVQPQDVEPAAVDRCPSGDPWCTPASPCMSCLPPVPAGPVEGVFDAVAAPSGLDDGPTLEVPAELVHGPAVGEVLDPYRPDWPDEDEQQSAWDLAAERRRQDRLDGDDGPETEYASARGGLS